MRINFDFLRKMKTEKLKAIPVLISKCSS